MAQKKRINSEKVVQKAQKRELMAEKERIKSRGDWMKEAQAAFNKWIRARDIDQPCISCGSHNRSAWDAGHYRTTAAAPELRFNEFNNNKQCVQCNQHQHGNLIEYRIGLIKKIGIDRVEWLEGPHEPAKYTIEQLKEIKAKYSRLARELLKE